MINKIEEILRSQIERELIENPIDRSKQNCYLKAAKEFNVSTEYIRSINRRLRNKGLVPETFTLTNNTGTHTTSSYEYKETRKEGGNIEITDTVDRKLTDDEIYERYGRSKENFKISMVWFKDCSTGFRLSVCFVPLKKNTEILDYQTSFKNYIDNLKVSAPIVKNTPRVKDSLKKGCLVFPSQDRHFNKYDINGNNNINDRFKEISKATIEAVEKAKLSSNLDKIVYVIGSDEFNSEWTSATTKFTPQQNILDYQTSFQAICDFETDMITYLATQCSELEVVLVSGNHDFYVAWHLAQFLNSYFRHNASVSIDASQDNTKILKYGNSLFLFNHSDEMKHKELVSKFPIVAKHLWSFCENYYIFTGDKHFEKAEDINGIKCFQVPQTSKAKSNWDDKKGFITQTAEMITFLIDEKEGLTDTYRKKI